MIKIIIILSTVFYSTIVNAQNNLTIKQFIDLSKKDSSFSLQIGATGQAFLLMNIELQKNNQKPIYCQPAKLSMNNYNYLKILEDQTKKYSNMLDNNYQEYPILMLNGLKEAFPCN
jgi:hypothetical protein